LQKSCGFAEDFATAAKSAACSTFKRGASRTAAAAAKRKPLEIKENLARPFL
jgi:hypothetical protein